MTEDQRFRLVPAWMRRKLKACNPPFYQAQNPILAYLENLPPEDWDFEKAPPRPSIPI